MNFMLIKPKGAVLRLAALALVVMFAGATFNCAAGEALESGHEHGAPPANHHGHSDADHGDQHDSDSGNCCSSLKSPVPSLQQPILKPNHTAWSALAIIALLPVSSAVMPAAGALFDHGPPGVSPPEFLLVSSLSPRSPPVLA